MQLTTRGRKSGLARTVKVWFVVGSGNSVYVQHASAAPAYWYQNLIRDPEVTIDFGDGPLAARATPVSEPARIDEILRLIRRKYPLAWIFQLLGRGRQAVAAEIMLLE